MATKKADAVEVAKQDAALAASDAIDLVKIRHAELAAAGERLDAATAEFEAAKAEKADREAALAAAQDALLKGLAS